MKVFFSLLYAGESQCMCRLTLLNRAFYLLTITFWSALSSTYIDIAQTKPLWLVLKLISKLRFQIQQQQSLELYLKVSYFGEANVGG